MTTYRQFLEAKAAVAPATGFHVTPNEIHPALKPHQADIVRWAVAGGRRAIFARFGLGKSIMQLETLRLTLANLEPDARALIVCPLGVRIEFANDAAKIDLGTRFIRRDHEIDGPGIYVTNYESVRDGRLNPDHFDAVSLDEASILRSFGSKTYQTFLTLFDNVPHRFVATATPSPNRYKELIHYAGFLGVMDTGQALTRFFQRDSTKANNITLYPHKEREFWLWVNTWAAFVQYPSDLGHADDGYLIPPMRIEWDEVDATDEVTTDRDGQAHLFRGVQMSLADAAREKRLSLPARVTRAMAIIDRWLDGGPQNLGDQVILWCDLNDEQTALERALTAGPADLPDAPIELAYINPYPADIGNDLGGITVFAFARKGAYVTPAGARPGNAVILTKGPAIETAGRTAEAVNAEAEAWIEGEMRRLFPHHYAGEFAMSAAEPKPSVDEENDRA